MTRIVITALVSCGLTLGIGYLLLPVLRALKAGQSIREVGPTWHNNKAGTPMMGGLMFIIAVVLCLLLSIPAMSDYSGPLLWRCGLFGRFLQSKIQAQSWPDLAAEGTAADGGFGALSVPAV